MLVKYSKEAQETGSGRGSVSLSTDDAVEETQTTGSRLG